MVEDHIPILLESIRVSGGPSPFIFEEVWFLWEEFMDVVVKEWNLVEFSGSPSRIFALKLKGLKIRLKLWSKVNVDSLRVESNRLVSYIKVLDKAGEDRSLSIEERTSRDLLRWECQLLILKGYFLEAKVVRQVVESG